LLCLVVDDLIARLSVGSVYCQGYADDICLLAVGKFPNTVSELMQRALHTVENWCGRVGLSVNRDKTDLVIFTRKRKLSGFFEPLFFGVTVHCSESVKYLGVIMDSQLTWWEHVNVKVKKAHNCGPVGGLLVLCGACGPEWFTGCTSLSFGHPSPLHL
jgi:hypothetical protein